MNPWVYGAMNLVNIIADVESRIQILKEKTKILETAMDYVTKDEHMSKLIDIVEIFITKTTKFSSSRPGLKALSSLATLKFDNPAGEETFLNEILARILLTLQREKPDKFGWISTFITKEFPGDKKKILDPVKSVDAWELESASSGFLASSRVITSTLKRLMGEFYRELISNRSAQHKKYETTGGFSRADIAKNLEPVMKEQLNLLKEGQTKLESSPVVRISKEIQSGHMFEPHVKMVSGVVKKYEEFVINKWGVPRGDEDKVAALEAQMGSELGKSDDKMTNEEKAKMEARKKTFEDQLEKLKKEIRPPVEFFANFERMVKALEDGIRKVEEEEAAKRVAAIRKRNQEALAKKKEEKKRMMEEQDAKSKNRAKQPDKETEDDINEVTNPPPVEHASHKMPTLEWNIGQAWSIERSSSLESLTKSERIIYDEIVKSLCK